MIKVKPKYKSYAPKYPSYLDKNPLEYPETMPYPFTDKMIDFLAKAGFVGALALSPMIGHTQTKDTVELYNPFPESAMNLPFRFAMFGTGSPERLTSQDAINVINHAFELEGLSVKKEKFLAIDSCKIRVNSYNEQYKIGFIWLDWRNAGSDLCEGNNWLSYQKENGKSYYQQFIDNSEAFFKNRLALRKRIFPKYNKIKDSKKEQFFYKQLYQYQIEKQQVDIQKRKDLTPKIKTWLMSFPDLFSDKITTNLYTKLYNLYNLLKLPNIKPLLEIEANEILKEKKKNRKKRSEKFVKIFNVVSASTLSESPYYKQLFIELFSLNWKERNLSIFKDAEDYLSISRQEIGFLTNPKNYFIAPISYKDKRITLRNLYLVDYTNFLTVEEKTQFEKIQKQFQNEKNNLIKDKLRKQMRPFYDKMRKLYKEAETKHKEEVKIKTLKRLENDVRMYIQWAKAQQGY